MPISPARAAAFEILLAIELEGAYASERLHASAYRKLSSADHGLATELVMGVLRWRSWLDGRIESSSSRKLERLDLEVLTALRMAAYQLEFLSRVPQRAAVHESVEMVRQSRKHSAVPFANAVLRQLAEAAMQPRAANPIAQAETPAELSRRSAHPLWLVERWHREFGRGMAQRVCMYDQQVPEAAIRLNAPEVEDELRRDGIVLAASPLLAGARRVEAGDVRKTRAFRERRVAIQDEASQLVALLVGKGSRILDCCAAPGGKTRILAGRNPGATIVAVELHPHRARLLRQLVPEKNVQVRVADMRELSPSAGFDCVLADVPCSGTGTLGRNPEIKWSLQPKDLAELAVRQAAILQAAMKHVEPGGRIVYSTCSLEGEENQQVMEKSLAAESSFRLLDCRAELERLRSQGELLWSDLNSLTRGSCLQTIPGVHPCDGFFAAVMHRDRGRH
jgi:16S rRNA (cytosine967-C5)-methyltransferase